MLDRYAANDWAWFFCLVAAAFGTYLLPFTQTLNNHTVGAFSAFFAALPLPADLGRRRALRLAVRGGRVLRGFAAANELPALALPGLAGPMLLVRYPGRTLLYFLPAAIDPAGRLRRRLSTPSSASSSCPTSRSAPTNTLTKGASGRRPWSWTAFNEHPEPYAVYLFHMTFGHHGIFSLTPIFLFSAWGGMRLLGGRRLLTLCIVLTLLTIARTGMVLPPRPRGLGPGRPAVPVCLAPLSIPILLGLLALLSAIPWLRGMDRPMEALAWMTAVLTVVVVAFYTWTPKARNYGGSAQGLRWIMWLIPFWLLLLPKGVEDGQARGRLRRLALARAGDLGPLGRLRHAQPLEPPLDPRRDGAPGPLPAETMSGPACDSRSPNSRCKNDQSNEFRRNARVGYPGEADGRPEPRPPAILIFLNLQS